MNIILASKSPRRKELMSLAGFDYEVDPSQSDEVIDTSLPLAHAIELVAQAKAEEVATRHLQDIIVAADTIVTCDGQVLGKPKDYEDAKRMLQMLQGRTHEVITGVCIQDESQMIRFHSTAKVTFMEMSQEEMERYLQTDEPYDKAGAYAVQGQAAMYISKIEGDYYTIVGLPISQVYHVLKDWETVD